MAGGDEHSSNSSSLHDDVLAAGAEQTNDGFCAQNTAPKELLHVVMVPYPLQGHINPMVQFAKALVTQHGVHMVTFVNNKHNHDCIDQAHHSPSPIVPHGKLHFTWVENGLPPDFDYNYISLRVDEYHRGAYNMKEPLKELLQSINQNGHTVSVLLFGTFCPWAHAAAEELGIPTVLFWTQSSTVFSVYYHAPLLIKNGFVPYNKKASSGGNGDHTELKQSNDVVSYIPGVRPLHASSLPTLLNIVDISKLEPFGIVQNFQGVIVNSFRELEKEAYEALQYGLPFPLYFVGPMLPRAFLNENDQTDTSSGTSLLAEESDCVKWLDAKPVRSVLYVSFGSLANPSPEDISSVAHGIRASKMPFLLVIRRPSSLVDVDHILPEGFTEDTREQGLIIPWAPQLRVLSHPSVGAFLTHCGWNSSLESLSMGVPIIGCPFFSDQTTNCTYISDVWKTGLALTRQDGKLKSEDVERAVKTLLQEGEGVEMRRRAVELRDAARLALSQGQGSSYLDIEKFVQALRDHKLQSDGVSLPCELIPWSLTWKY